MIIASISELRVKMQEKSDYIEVLAVSDMPLIREGMISVLSAADDIKVVGHASNMLELMYYLCKLNPNVVILNDECTKGISSLEAISLINQKAIDAKVVLLIEDYDDDKELTALEMGVKGFLLKRTAKSDFIRCIRAVNSDEMWARKEIIEKLVKQLLRKLRREENKTPSMPAFTKRETELMTLVSKDYRNKEIARTLSLSEETVKHHLSKIFKKLNIKKRTDIKQYFWR